jgi:hypothetical protein
VTNATWPPKWKVVGRSDALKRGSMSGRLRRAAGALKALGFIRNPHLRRAVGTPDELTSKAPNLV